ANGFAYVTASGVYFDISKMPDYGKLSGQNLEKIRAGARIEVDEKKKNPEDFALWKIDGAGCAHQPAQGVCAKCATSDSPWGRGRPGWHIECSAMSLEFTGGAPLDLHGGARDLIFPHHENEIAQSEAAGTRPFARHWAHTGFLTVRGEKMAKSLGNFITIEDGLKRWDAQTLRLFYALTHYRSPIDLSAEALAGAKTTLEHVRNSLAVMEGEGVGAPDSAAEVRLAQEASGAITQFAQYMDADLDTPHALSALITGAKQVARAREENKCSRKVLEMASKQISDGFAVLGLEVGTKAQEASPSAAAAPKLPKEQIEQLIASRQEARAKKDFQAADAIRKQLAGAGVILEDTKEGTPKWRYA
ncbi:MAG: class I tRNA ligase family protein, partial [Candidatus Micrarchaeota archaeon]|nr:class I tRNA ligase family protein [Candidatus Micrarchaeota archaeon]